MATIVCPSCGTELDDTLAFCPKDGTPLKGGSRGKTPSGPIGTLVGHRATSEQEAQKIKAALAAGEGKSVPRPTDPSSRPSVADSEPRRNIGGILIAAVVLVAIAGLIVFAMKR